MVKKTKKEILRNEKKTFSLKPPHGNPGKGDKRGKGSEKGKKK